MTKINENNSLQWLYKIGFFIILALPILTIPPYFYPADWGKNIIFRSIMAILLFLCLWQFLKGKNEFDWKIIKKSKIVLAMAALFIVYFLASIFSVDPLFSFWGSPYRGGGFISFAFYFAFAILTFLFFKKEGSSAISEQSWKKAWNFSILVGVFVSLIGIIQYFGLFNKIFMPEPSRPPSTMGNPIMLAIYLLLLSFITLSFAIKESGKNLKIFYFSSLAIFLYTILITESRAAYFGLAAGALYFLLAYPKKIKVAKIAAASLVILAVAFVFYVNTENQYPKFLQQNKLFISITSRLTIRSFLEDPRFYAWAGIDYKILIDKPILGYGPENFSVGFDKYYNPSIPYLSESWGGWWDKAHNIILQTGSDAGFLGIICYLALFIVLFWQLQKTKNKTTPEKNLITTGIQAALIGYFVANLFSFDSFGSYIIFFLLIGYSLNIIYDNSEKEIQSQIQKKTFLKSACIFILFIILAIFLWQYNFLPLQINAKINKARDLANQKQCDQSLALMDSALQSHSFLDSYARMEYIEFEKTCSGFYPENNLTYLKKGVELANEAVKIQPLYTRYWIFLGDSMVTLAQQEQDGTPAQTNYINLANNYFDKALQSAPKHQEIFIGKAQIDMITGDYKGAKDYSEKCVAQDPNLSSCYFYLGLSEIYLKDNDSANKNIQIASNKGYDINSQTSLVETANAYGSLPDYKNLVVIFEKLTALNPNVAQYYSSLANFYVKIGEYNKARQAANKVLQLSPESKQNVESFLNSLP